MSTATKLTYLNDTKGLIKQSINNLGGEITSQTTFRQYATELDSIYASLPKVSGSGSNISLSPTLKGRLSSTPKGDTYQFSTTGKNLVNYDGTQVNLVKSTNRTINITPDNFPLTLSAGTYTISFPDLVMTNNNYNLSVQLVGAMSGGTQLTNKSYTLTLTEQKTITRLYIFINNSDNDNATATFSKIQLETGSSATSYEPYTGGTASPSPSYQQNIQSVTGLQKITISGGTGTIPQEYEINLGKNLFDKNNANSINAYIDSGSNAIYTNENNKLLYIPIIGGKTYTVSKVKSDRFTIATTSVVPANNVSTLNLLQDNNATSLTITAPSNAKYLAVHYYRSSDTLTPEQILDSIQIEVGSQATTYSPYFTPIKLNKIGNYQDYIIGSPNNWSIKKQIGNRTLTGNDNWNKETISGNSNFYVNIPDALGGKDNQIYNNMGNYANNLTQNYNTYISSGTTTKYLNFRYFEITNLNDFKTFLNTTNMEIVYILAEETTEPITNTELIEDLNNLYYAKSYNGTTNITITSEDLELIMTASALKGE